MFWGIIIKQHGVVAVKFTVKAREALKNMAQQKTHVSYCHLHGLFWLFIMMNIQILAPYTSVLERDLDNYRIKVFLQAAWSPEKAVPWSYYCLWGQRGELMGQGPQPRAPQWTRLLHPVLCLQFRIKALGVWKGPKASHKTLALKPSSVLCTFRFWNSLCFQSKAF